MPFTEKERAQLEELARKQAEKQGITDEAAMQEFVAAYLAAAEEIDAEEKPADDPQDRAPGKNDPAGGGTGGGESGAKAHGGKGYFAYEYPFLTVNEIRESLFLPPLGDGGMFSGEWLTKHSGGAQPAPPDGGDEPPPATE